MKYLLKNKDRVVLEFEVSLKHSVISNNFEECAENIVIKDKNLLPISMVFNNIQKNLLNWIKKRKAPTNRSYIKKIISTYKDNTSEEKIMDYVNVSFALSLNDSYWITPTDKQYSWQQYNLYSNDFAKSLELAAFGIQSQKVSGFTSSPEYTTNGMLPKCWHRENGGIYLYKGSSKIYENGEVYSEYYMSQVAKLLDFSHAHYDLKMFHNRLVSTCPIFTNENEGYMPIGYCIDTNIRKEKGFTLINEVKKIYGKESLQDLMLFDALICNVDRHLGNFGMIIDNNTNELLRPAPIFDNGLSMMTTLSTEELKDDKKFLGFEKSAFEISFNNQLEYSTQPRHIPNLEKLQTFEFKKHKEFNLPDEWLESIQKAIQDRAKLAIDFCHKKQSKTIAADKIRAMPKPSAEIEAKSKEFLNELRQSRNADKTIESNQSQTKSKVRKR